MAVPASAQTAKPPPLPPLDLGQTNILDGEGQPGLLLELITLGSLANRLTDAHGASVPGRNDQRIGSVIPHPIYTSNAVIAGAHPGVEVLLPVSWVDNDFAMNGGRHAGLGDLSVAPFLEWASKPAAGAISVRLALQVVAPTGDYVAGRAANTGQGGWQIGPYFAVTWRATARWEVSARAIYDWSGSVESRTSAGAPSRARPGDLVALDLSMSYAATNILHLGVGSYVLSQISDSRVADMPVPDSRAQVFGAGPVARLEIGKSAVLFAAYGEFDGRNRPEGGAFNVRFQRAF